MQVLTTIHVDTRGNRNSTRAHLKFDFLLARWTFAFFAGAGLILLLKIGTNRFYNPNPTTVLSALGYLSGLLIALGLIFWLASIYLMRDLKLLSDTKNHVRDTNLWKFLEERYKRWNQ